MGMKHIWQSRTNLTFWTVIMLNCLSTSISNMLSKVLCYQPKKKTSLQSRKLPIQSSRKIPEYRPIRSLTMEKNTESSLKEFRNTPGEVLLERTEKRGIVLEIKQKQLITCSPNSIID